MQDSAESAGVGTASAGHACAHDRAEGGCAACKVRLVSVCAALTREELAGLEALSQQVHLDPRQALFQQDDRAGAVYNVTEGSLRLSRLLPDGRRQVMGFALVGDFLGLALPERFTVTAEALAPTMLCRKREGDGASPRGVFRLRGPSPARCGSITGSTRVSDTVSTAMERGMKARGVGSLVMPTMLSREPGWSTVARRRGRAIHIPDAHPDSAAR